MFLVKIVTVEHILVVWLVQIILGELRRARESMGYLEDRKQTVQETNTIYLEHVARTSNISIALFLEQMSWISLNPKPEILN